MIRWLVISLLLISEYGASQDLAFSLRGKVLDRISGMPVSGVTVKLLRPDGEPSNTRTNSMGEYLFDSTLMEVNISYSVTVNGMDIRTFDARYGYLGRPIYLVSTGGADASIHFVKDFILTRVVDKSWSMPVVFFPYQSSVMGPDQAHKLQYVRQIISESPGLLFTVTGGCSQDESPAVVLGKARAMAAVDFLVNLGVNRERLNISTESGSAGLYMEKDTMLSSGKIVTRGTVLSKKWIKKNLKKKGTPEEIEWANRMNRRVTFYIEEEKY